MKSRPLLLVLAMVIASISWPVRAQSPQLQKLHNDLNLTPQQETAWQTFEAATMIDPQEAARRRSAAQMMPTLTAPQRVDLSIAAMQADLDSYKRRGVALKTFYANLSPSQQTIFDSETVMQQ
jgi:protein CpxP